MPRFERLRAADWRAWLALAWVVWFSLLYGKTVVDARGGKLRDAISALLSRPAAGQESPTFTDRPRPSPGQASRP